MTRSIVGKVVRQTLLTMLLAVALYALLMTVTGRFGDIDWADVLRSIIPFGLVVAVVGTIRLRRAQRTESVP